MSLPYEVSRKFGQSPGKIIATCIERADAELVMKARAEYDQKTKVDSIYELINSDDDEVLLTIESKKYSFSQQTDPLNSASTGGGFNPNPFSTTATPAGFKSNFTSTKKDSNDEDL